MRIIAITMLLVYSMFGVAEKPKEAAKIPTITAEQRARFWRAQAEAINAAVRARAAQDVLVTVQSDLLKSCGDWAFIAGEDGEPTCRPKPEPAKK
ncbi:MAG: hypothetical protein P4K93_07625 [Terracidiphilus sp.]|nr:hypothetical protein [Terracidiphilus sp.]